MTPALATREQIEAEVFTNSLMEEHGMRRALEALREECAGDRYLLRPRGPERFEQDLRQWAACLVMREMAGDPNAPRILWIGDTTPRTWCGHTFGGAALAGDNPDAIYRHVFVDGAATYELTGRFPENPAAQFSIEPIPGLAGVIPATGTLTGALGTTRGPALLTDKEIVREKSDGGFRIILGADADSGAPNQLALPPQPVSINLRDILADWTQRPVPLTMRRLSGPSAPALTRNEIRALVMEHLPAFVRHWVSFKDRWLGGIAPNTYQGPLGRAGGWSYILAGRYTLEPGQAIVLTATADGAGYNGAQVTDPWQVTLNNALHQGSLNITQTIPDPDGSVTYVIAPEDPGAANWLDTDGCADGFFFVRWQLFGPSFDPAKLISRFEVIRLSELDTSRLPGVSREERRRRVDQRAIDYARRLTS